mgnify:CR=1 FL=1
MLSTVYIYIYLYEAYVLGSVSILKGQPQHRELHALPFTNSVWVL